MQTDTAGLTQAGRWATHTPWRKKDGTILVVILLVLAALTVLGVLSINSSLVEMQLVDNGNVGRKNFYRAESAAIEGIQRIDELSQIDMEEKISVWHHSPLEARDGKLEFRNPELWDGDGNADDNAIRSAVDDSLFIAAVEWRLATGSSAVATGPRLYLNRIYGLSLHNNCPIIVEVGVYKRY